MIAAAFIIPLFPFFKNWSDVRVVLKMLLFYVDQLLISDIDSGPKTMKLSYYMEKKDVGVDHHSFTITKISQDSRIISRCDSSACHSIIKFIKFIINDYSWCVLRVTWVHLHSNSNLHTLIKSLENVVPSWKPKLVGVFSALQIHNNHYNDNCMRSKPVFLWF